MERRCDLLRVLLAGVSSLLSGGLVCTWACNHGERQGVAMVATLGGLVGATLGGGATLGDGVTTLVGGVDMSGSRV